MISRKVVISSFLSFILGSIFTTYFIFIELLDSSVLRVSLLSSFLVSESEKNEGSSAENVVAILHDDIYFYTSYRLFAPGFITAPLDKTFCMSFRISPNSHDEEVYLLLINNKEIESVVTNRASYCFGEPVTGSH